MGKSILQLEEMLSNYIIVDISSHIFCDRHDSVTILMILSEPG